jgi:S-methylmethionine-dependent homocysteine/selenocysteine methylase
MDRYRGALPQLAGTLFVTDGGLETTLIFHDGLVLPDFAAFHLLATPEGEAALRKYFRTYAEIATRVGTGLILESATWRASADWGKRLGYTPEGLADAHRRAVHLLEGVRSEYDTERTPVVISGCLGPRGDGYVPDRAMSAQEAEDYHREQVETFAGTAVDMVCAMTMNYVEEVEADGTLPTG